jgi:hypothetical protein
MKSVLSFLLLAFLLHVAATDAVLNNLPVTFTMSGSAPYIPDAGGSSQTGYTLTIGYVGQSWLGVEFVNSGANSDFIVLKISDFFTNNGNSLNTGHQVTYADYYESTPGTLSVDTTTTYDISSYAYSSTKSYSLQITRYIGSNGGQDWDGNANSYSMQKICFYSSNQTFDPSSFNQFYSQCYFYEINNYVSTFVGSYLKTFMLNGYSTAIYGYIDGPIVTNKIFFYQSTPLYSYVQTPAVIIEIGTTSGNYGQDYYASSPITSECGDYYGSSVNLMSLDNNAAGFQNPALTVKTWNTNTSAQISGLGISALRINFTRAVYTYDSYDKSMLSTFLFCMYLYSSGSTSGALSDKGCEVVELSPVYVQMGLASSGEGYLSVLLLAALMMMISII